MFEKAKVRLGVACALVASVTASANPDARYIKWEKTTTLLEHLVRHSAALSLNYDISRALGYTLTNDRKEPFRNCFNENTPFVGPFMKNVLWNLPMTAQFTPGTQIQQVDAGGGFFKNGQLIYVQNPRINGIDFQIGSVINKYQKETTYLLDQWRRKVSNPKAAIDFAQTYKQTQNAYIIARDALEDYIIGANNIYLGNQDPRLEKQLNILIANLESVNELMLFIRFARPFALPIPRVVVELSYQPIILTPGKIMAYRPHPYPMPTKGGGFELVQPDGYQLQPMPKQAPTPAYDVDAWERRWGNYEDGYQQPGGPSDGRGLIPAQGGNSGGAYGPAPVQGNDGGGYGPAPVQGSGNGPGYSARPLPSQSGQGSGYGQPPPPQGGQGQGGVPVQGGQGGRPTAPPPSSQPTAPNGFDY